MMDDGFGPRPPPREALDRAQVVLVSACMLGATCRYDGGARGDLRLREALAGKQVVPVCPETAAGLGVPRPAVELSGGCGRAVLRGEARAVTVSGREDRTEAFVAGAQLALQAARQHGASAAILKERSPSCGSRTVHVDGALRDGEGVTTALLRAHGIAVLGESEL